LFNSKFPYLAALPPKYRNDKELSVIIKFIKVYPKVISSLRKVGIKSKDWARPIVPLEYKKSNCEGDYPE
jgi:hypothetical protein